MTCPPTQTACGSTCGRASHSVFSQGQLADLGGGPNGGMARGNIFNALMHDDDPRSLIEIAIGGAGRDALYRQRRGQHAGRRRRSRPPLRPRAHATSWTAAREPTPSSFTSTSHSHPGAWDRSCPAAERRPSSFQATRAATGSTCGGSTQTPRGRATRPSFRQRQDAGSPLARRGRRRHVRLRQHRPRRPVRVPRGDPRRGGQALVLQRRRLPALNGPCCTACRASRARPRMRHVHPIASSNDRALVSAVRRLRARGAFAVRPDHVPAE